MKRSFWLYIMNILVILFIVIMGLTLITLPFLVDKYAELTGKIINNSLWVKIFLLLTRSGSLHKTLKPRKKSS